MRCWSVGIATLLGPRPRQSRDSCAGSRANVKVADPARAVATWGLPGAPRAAESSDTGARPPPLPAAASPMERREVEAPSPLGLAAEVGVGVCFVVLAVCDLGVVRRARAGESNDLQFAEFYFAQPTPLKAPLQALARALAYAGIPKLLWEHARPLWRGAGYAHHWLGVGAAAFAAATAAVETAVLGPRRVAADAHFFDVVDADALAGPQAAVAVLACVAVALVAGRTWAAGAAAAGTEILFSPL